MNDGGKVLIIGAGPAGLTAAYELTKHGIIGTIIESDSGIGGLARTIEFGGYRFDIGAHRFFTKVPEIDKLWEEMLGEPLVKLPRLTRILYGGKFYDYPLKAGNALKNMGVLQATECLLSYLKARLRPNRNPANFEQWVTNQFGVRLFNMFFKSYTEKVWGCSCTEIGADWASQRIKGLNLGEAVRHALFGQRKGDAVRTLVDEFKYPRLGPGQLWEACARTIQNKGWTINMRTRVTSVDVEDRHIAAIHAKNQDGAELHYPAEQVFSSMPLRELLLWMKPRPPDEVIKAATSLGYRDFLVVALVLDKTGAFPDNWIYVHSPNVRVGRIDNFANWTKEMTPDTDTCCLAMEYFVFENDELWNSPDAELIKLAYRELGEIGLATAPLIKGYVVRMPKAYPVYDPGYKERLDVIRHWLGKNILNLHCMGRNGQHRYNNQDHSMATALIAARNVALGQSRDPWAVNEDAEYHEIAKTERQTPLTPAVALASEA
ncbi:MAG TPA: NAD(P)/FAD-dependent oxidoreductase [Tepidisphaeraceae bacterium]|nr:NAD(P)/FAD-dependent oxidoreductase [Tepidisphaeraceae bacterium]